MVSVMSVSNIRVLKCFIVEERRISRTYSELVKQESVVVFCDPCSSDMHAYYVVAFDKN